MISSFDITKKQEIIETVFSKVSYKNPITFGEINIELLPDDVILSGYEEAQHGSDSGMDAHYHLSVERTRLETDEVFEERKKEVLDEKEYFKEKRYQQYLALKKEFEKK
ncbi:MAG: hypothetical protein ACOCVF_03915 [bacterium]